MRTIFFLILGYFCFLPVHAQNETSKDYISLAGIWNFKLNPLNISIPVKGIYLVSKFPEEITLPGSTNQARKGFKTQDMSSLRLTRMFEYSGAAWYEKEQWYTYPDFNQTLKYVGILKPYNYELFRENLRNKKMLDQAHKFHIASDKFQVL